jgi:two-component sensor histidine kinase
VSNNIQVVAALLALQRRGVSDDAARKALDEASQRLTLIGKIGRALYDPDGQQLGVHTFVRTLATDILEASGRKDIAVDIQVDESITVQPDAAVPLSLILAEAINNAVEHGFAGREAGTISIALRRSDGDRIVLDVSDDGHGLPPGYVQDNSGSLGLRIASALAQQLGGTFALEQRDAGGVRARLDIPA